MTKISYYHHKAPAPQYSIEKKTTSTVPQEGVVSTRMQSGETESGLFLACDGNIHWIIPTPLRLVPTCEEKVNNRNVVARYIKYLKQPQAMKV